MTSAAASSGSSPSIVAGLGASSMSPAGESKRALGGLDISSLIKPNDFAVSALKDRLRGIDAGKLKREYDEAQARLDPMYYINKRLEERKNAVESNQDARNSIIDAMVAQGLPIDQIEAVATQFSNSLSIAGDLRAEIAAPSGLTHTSWQAQTKGEVPPPPADAGKRVIRRKPARRAAPKKKRSARK